MFTYISHMWVSGKDAELVPDELLFQDEFFPIKCGLCNVLKNRVPTILETKLPRHLSAY